MEPFFSLYHLMVLQIWRHEYIPPQIPLLQIDPVSSTLPKSLSQLDCVSDLHIIWPTQFLLCYLSNMIIVSSFNFSCTSVLINRERGLWHIVEHKNEFLHSFTEIWCVCERVSLCACVYVHTHRERGRERCSRKCSLCVFLSDGNFTFYFIKCLYVERLE